MSDAARDIVKYSDSDYNPYHGEICRINLKAMWNSSWGEQVLDRLLAERSWPYGARQEAITLCRASIGAEISYEFDSLVRERDFLLLLNISVKDPSSQIDSECSINEEKGSCSGISWHTEINSNGSPPPTSPQILWLDYNSLNHPLIWRFWREGDRLEPSGMVGTVSISDLLTQWKVPHTLRNKAKILIDGRDKILWVFVSSEDGAKSRISRNISLSDGEKKLIVEAQL